MNRARTAGIARWTPGLIAGVVLVSPPGWSYGQPDGATPAAVEPAGAADALSRLREENERLSRQVASLERRVAEMNATLADLASVLRDLARDIPAIREAVDREARSGAGAVDPPAASSDEPFASPDDLLAALRARYTEEFGKDPLPDHPARRREAAEAWLRATNRALRGRANWLVRVSEARIVEQGKTTATMTVLDPLTRAARGGSFTVAVPGEYAKVVRDGGDAVYELSVLVSSEAKYNPERPDRGVFETPPLVGAYVDFAYRLEWRLLRAVRGSDSGDDRTRTPR
ncbi:MAG: hypothetical protein HRU70_14910 [Phycisphaeraceae bacterium]|nr:MAG: hypothetical protein HRU70_14910 [Phycisphaeraceae bacterium]